MNTSPTESTFQRLIAAVLRGVLRAMLRPTFRAGRPFAQQRRRLERIARLTLPARGVTRTPTQVGGVPGERLQTRGTVMPQGTVLYLHGGAYCVGSPATHRSITTRLARLTGASVFAAEYRLAP
ncbi:MAG: alpha/beta hydrolase fold domain-containing protein, partial [Gammaproteobacteria bacterium]|nr:alpha/beta hydrolase fold domain-containing protein [Gammaproteobacteria bacterium]